MTNIAAQTLASIVTNDSQSATVLEKYNLDFCCKGKRTLTEACAEKGLSVDELINELETSRNAKQTGQMPFTEMSCEQMIGYILIHHHFYVKQSMPIIEGHLEKVAAKHGDRFPNMVEVLSLFTEIRHEMTSHMQKEEMILFPRIKELENAVLNHSQNQLGEAFISGPVAVMMQEHDHAGDILYRIRELTNNYEIPEGACTTFQVSLGELKEFEEDLHKHVHLENNHLFPKAISMMEEMEVTNK